MDYAYPSKAHWRRWLMNRIVERLSVPPRDALVLYLAGPQDLDRPELLRRGFRQDNLIAVERDTAVVEQLRSRGVLTIRGDIWDVVEVWPKTLPLHAVLADLVGGMGKKEWAAFRVLAGPCVERPPVFAVNMLRGRDPQGNAVRESYIKRWPVLDAVVKTHRGRQLLAASYMGWLFEIAALALLGPEQFNKRIDDSSLVAAILAHPEFTEARMVALEREAADLLDRWMWPAVSSYRSTAGNQWFDSLILGWLGAFPLKFVAPPADFEGAGDTKRRIAAVLAHRTRRVRPSAAPTGAQVH